MTATERVRLPKGDGKKIIEQNLFLLHDRSVNEALAILAELGLELKDEKALRDKLDKVVAPYFTISGHKITITTTPDVWSQLVGYEVNAGTQPSPANIYPSDSVATQRRRTADTGPEHSSVRSATRKHTRPSNFRT